MDFCNADNAWLIDYQFARLRPTSVCTTQCGPSLPEEFDPAATGGIPRAPDRA